MHELRNAGNILFSHLEKVVESRSRVLRQHYTSACEQHDDSVDQSRDCSVSSSIFKYRVSVLGLPTEG